jgi:hypothetical protein
MFRFKGFALILGLSAMAALPTLSAQERDRADRKDPDAAAIAEAIRFQKAEDAAAARQARIEAASVRSERSPDRVAPAETKARPHTVKSASAHKPPQPRSSQ